MRLIASLLACALLASALLAQKKNEVLVSFSGTLKRVTKHEIVIEPEPDNQMTFVRTKRTKFTSGGKEMNGAALPQGIVVSVQAFEKLNRELEAVSVSVGAPDQSPNK